MNKKNFFKLLGIIAIVALVGLSMISCDDKCSICGDNGGSSLEISVTDIPSQYNNKIGLVGFSTGTDSNNLVAWAGSKIVDGVMKGNSLCWDCDKSYNLNGTYYIILVIDDDSYNGSYILPTLINGTSKSFSYSEFIYLPSSSSINIYPSMKIK